jgi:hypothetical protein
VSWQNLVDGNPELAAYGAKRFEGRVGYLATVDEKGSPRAHPVSPRVIQNRLLIFMYPTSPKAHDLQRDGRYALHCAVEDREGGEGEFYVRGKARQNLNAADWELIRPGHSDEFNTRAFSMIYVGDETVRNRWKQA